MYINIYFLVGENFNYLYIEFYENGYGILVFFIIFYFFKYYKVEYKIKVNYFESLNYF